MAEATLVVLQLAAEVTRVVLRLAAEGVQVQVELLRVAVGDPVVEVADAAQALEVGTQAVEPWFGPNGVPRASQALPAVATAKVGRSGVAMVMVRVAVIARQGWNDAVMMMVHAAGIVIAAIGWFPECGKGALAITR